MAPIWTSINYTHSPVFVILLSIYTLTPAPICAHFRTLPLTLACGEARILMGEWHKPTFHITLQQIECLHSRYKSVGLWTRAWESSWIQVYPMLWTHWSRTHLSTTSEHAHIFYFSPVRRRWILKPANVSVESDLNSMSADFASAMRGWRPDAFRPQNLSVMEQEFIECTL